MARFLAALAILVVMLGLVASGTLSQPGSHGFDAAGAALPSEDCDVPRGDPSSIPARPRLLSAVIDASGASATYSNYSGGCTFDIGLASYQIFAQYEADHTPVMESQKIFDLATATLDPGQSLTLTIALPGCLAQVDAFHGDIITTFAYGERYSPRLLDASIVGDMLCTRASGTGPPRGW
jgi:hypothetical protein